jgi:hypothetical protein
MIKITIAGNEYRPATGSLQIENCIEERTSCSFLIDDPGVPFEKGMAVTISDDSGTVIFAGFVDSVRERVIDNQNYIRTAISCIDYHYAADKRLAARAYQGQKAGDIVRDLVERYLEEEGVVAGTILEDLKDYTLQEIADGEADI